MASKMVTDRQKSAEAVVAVGTAQASALAQAIDETVRLDGNTKLETGALVGAMTVLLGQARTAMVEADAAHEREVADDPAIRTARDDSAARLSARIVELREIVGGLYGAPVAQQLLPGRTPQDPVVLARFGGEVAAAVRTAELPAPRIAGAKLDQEAISGELETMRTDLQARIEDVAREAREHDVTLVLKNRSITDYDRVFQGVASVLTGLFTLAGQDELAGRVRPSTRRPGRTAEQDDAPAPVLEDPEATQSAA